MDLCSGVDQISMCGTCLDFLYYVQLDVAAIVKKCLTKIVYLFLW